MKFAHIYSGKGINTSLIATLCIVLVVIIATVYMQSANHRFLNIDDDVYVTNNRHVAGGLTAKNIVWAFTSVDEANWHPVTWLSHMTDVQLYGMNPRGHHLTSVAIHTVATLLLFYLLLLMTNKLWQSLFVADLFALHPLHVESVAWVAERKDVLSALFLFLTLILYVRYVASGKTGLYIFALLSFVVGLMAKPMLVTVPLIMLLLDFWPLNRYQNEAQQLEPCQRTTWQIKLVKEKIPFFACSMISGLITIYAQWAGGAVANLYTLPFRPRLENALLACIKYVGKTIWPGDLAVFYPFPVHIPLWQVIGSLLILSILSYTAIRSWLRFPYFTTGWFWFLITLAPVIGILQTGSQSMADRYTYTPIIGLFIIAAWGVPELARGLRHRQVIISLIAAMVIITAAALTWRQLGYWQDNFTLYRHTLQVTSDNKKIHFNLGLALAEQGDHDAAIREFKEIIRISPNDADAYYNLGVAFAGKGDLNSAITAYRKARQLNPNDIDTHNNLGRALAIKGYLDEAILEYREVLRINPGDKNAYFNIKSTSNARTK